MTLQPDELAEQMMKHIDFGNEPEWSKMVITKRMLRKVLEAIERGEVVELESRATEVEIVLKPEFKRFMEAK